MVNDGSEEDYPQARSLYADPEAFLNRIMIDSLRANKRYEPKHEHLEKDILK